MYSVELFTGAGGLALGVHRAGFHHLAVVEYNRDACDTLRLNTARHLATGVHWPIIETDVRSFDYTPYMARRVDLLAGGAPCQPFSLGGKHAGQDDARNMFPEVFRAVRALRPRAVLLENVRGLVRESFRPYFQYLLDQLEAPFVVQKPGEAWEEHHARVRRGMAEHSFDPAATYHVKWRCYNTADFGVPQERQRVFIVAFRRDLDIAWQFPEPTHSQDALLYQQYVSGEYWEAHHLDPRPTPARFASKVQRLAARGRPFAERWRTVRDVLSDLPEPIDYDPVPPLDHHVGIPDARSYPGHTGSPWDWPAKAIKAGDHGNPGGENMLRREDESVRYFTVRELARLQTFPDSWHFANSWTEIRRQLGNAVPVAMAEMLACLIREALDHADLQQQIEYPQEVRRVEQGVAVLSQ
jgi:DNA (cytosine-5)-methyltransferase 1